MELRRSSTSSGQLRLKLQYECQDEWHETCLEVSHLALSSGGTWSCPRLSLTAWRKAPSRPSWTNSSGSKKTSRLVAANSFFCFFPPKASSLDPPGAFLVSSSLLNLWIKANQLHPLKAAGVSLTTGLSDVADLQLVMMDLVLLCSLRELCIAGPGLHLLQVELRQWCSISIKLWDERFETV